MKGKTRKRTRKSVFPLTPALVPDYKHDTKFTFAGKRHREEMHMATKKELLEGLTKAKLLALAEGAGVTAVKPSMKKDALVEALANSRKVSKAAIEAA